MRSFTAFSLLVIFTGCSVSAIFEFEAYLKASNAGFIDNFGYSVSLSGDTLAVGAPYEASCATAVSTIADTDNNCSGTGAAYVFVRAGATWTLEAYVKPPNTGGSFGHSVSLSGNTLAVGARYEASCTTNVSTTAATDVSCIGAGAAYVFTRSGAMWTFEAYLKAPNAGPADAFGTSVSLLGDTLAVGAPHEDSCATTVSTIADKGDGCINRGAVYVFARSGATWTLEAYVKAPNAGDDYTFGHSVSLSGDTLAVGAYWERSCSTTVSTTADTGNGCSGAGAVYVFTRSGTTWTLEAYVKAPNAGEFDNFGYSVSLSGDTLAVTARYEESCMTTVSTTADTGNGCTQAGAAYVFTRSGTTWTLEAYVKAPNAGTEDRFGWSISLSGDTLAVGARYEESCSTTLSTTADTGNGCNQAGAAYVFTRSGTTWAFAAYVKASTAGAYDMFGESLALSGDTLAVGAMHEDSCTTTMPTTAATDDDCADAGAIYVYVIPSLPPPSPHAASISGDLHVRGGHGDSFDFKGEHNGIYVLLSSPALSISACFVHSSFFTPYSKLLVHGSRIKHVFWTVRTRHGQLLQADLNATSPSFNGSTAKRTKTVDGVTFTYADRALTVSTPQWFTRATVQEGQPHPGHLRLALTVRPLYNVKQSNVAPHGLLGQTYDNGNPPLHGKRDPYAVLDDGTQTGARRKAGGVVTTRARGEGAIEGNVEMYRVHRPYDTEFAFSRFGSTTHLPARNASLLRSDSLG